MVEVVKKMKSEFERGREAALSDVELHELFSLPGLDYLDAYFSERFADHKRGLIMANAVKRCSPFDSEEVLSAIRDLPEAARDALYLAMVRYGEFSDRERKQVLDFCQSDLAAAVDADNGSHDAA
jgi:hypothetical protein